ncbi:carbamoyltransferase C-terminal domain-containing protein [Streptomyces halstedii]|uniref:carbamoyltransferase C-terminal domain-containing protein n=1 Tax=Streptomyces halstedii TaxID=1944 RepID=UPI00382A0B76
MADLTSELLTDAGIVSSDVDHWIATSTESRNAEDEAQLARVLGLLAPPDRSLQLPHPGHHLAHASAAFYSSGFDEAAALVIDAYGSRVGSGRERETAFHFRPGAVPERVMEVIRDADRIAGHRRDGHIWLPEKLSGVGELYRVVTLALGFRESGTLYDDAGKTMGLASYGERLSEECLFIETAPKGGLSFDRAADSLVELGFAVREEGGLRLVPRPSRAPYEQFHFDLAAQIQAEFEEAVLHVTREVLARTGVTSLVVSGGCFLNSILNTRILNETDAERLFIFPAATDDGNSAGAALYAYHHLTGRPAKRSPAMKHVYLGPSRLSGRDLKALADEWKLTSRRYQDAEHVAAAAADAIAEGEIVGWFQDRAEFGPRSLGARSILCHPGINGMKDRLNARVKFRESFRPFAGSVLAEQAEKWFDLPTEESPFMLHVCSVLPEQRDTVSEIVHVDGTCRVQTVNKETPGPFRALIEAFQRTAGLPVVLNTSFNLRGMPMVERPEEAIDCLYGSRLDRLFIGDLEIEAPDLNALCPVRAQSATSGTVGLPSAGDEAKAPAAGGVGYEGLRVLELADGQRSMRTIAEELGTVLDETVDLTLDLRRHGLVQWKGLPVVGRPVFPLPQYSPDAFAE